MLISLYKGSAKISSEKDSKFMKPIDRGVMQGDSLSAYTFIICI